MTLSVAVANGDDATRLIAAKCASCHSGEEPAGKLDLTVRDKLLLGGESGPAFLPADLENSPLWARVAAGEMPPKKPLAEEERALVKRWLIDGANYPPAPLDPNAFSSDTRAGYDWWSLQRPRDPALPELSADLNARVRDPIDRFVFAKLAANGLTPSRDADRATFVRRVTFDLTGLPPTPEEVAAFIADERPNAYERLVDRLLDSPAYGERMARHWLDVAHFGESDGYEYDKMRPQAWRWRDWVIESFHADRPYDEFIRHQIAGDAFAPESHDAHVAVGFLVHGAFDSLLPAFESQRKIMRQDELEDIVGLVGQTFLGLTVHCARCHDHKFDPLRQQDYYRFSAALAAVKRGERTIPPKLVPQELVDRHATALSRWNDLTEQGRKLAQAALDATGDASPGSSAPVPLAAWDFRQGLEDLVGGLHARLEGGAKQTPQGLVVDGVAAFATTGLLPKTVTEKTLEAWVQLTNVDQQGGAAISLQTPGGGRFDAIVFGEREPKRWMAGSDGYVRYKSFNGPEDPEAAAEPVHFAIVYRGDGTIAGYRNGQAYGQSYVSQTPAIFEQDRAEVVFGLRHAPVAGSRMLAGTIVRAALYDRALSDEEVSLAASAVGKFVTEATIQAALAPNLREERAQLKDEIDSLSRRLLEIREPKAYTIAPEGAPTTHLLARGNPAAPREEIVAGALSPLVPPGATPDFPLPADAPESARRAALAQWIASAENPLTARVMVNRLWTQRFGRGLVETPSDLGFSGGAPSHPELLDWLAVRFVEGGWRIKPIVRRMVLSTTYRQGSAPRAEALAKDAGNRLYWRQTPRRLDAESVRDATLAVAGALNPERGGPSYMDFRPYFHKGAMFYEPLDPPGPTHDRRSIYRMWVRGGRNPLLDTLDCPDPSVAAPKRGSTTTPLQALSMLNGDFMLRMADVMSERLKRESPDNTTAQIDRACRLTWSRPPKPTELEASRTFVEKHGLAAYCRVLLNGNGFLYVD